MSETLEKLEMVIDKPFVEGDLSCKKLRVADNITNVTVVGKKRLETEGHEVRIPAFHNHPDMAFN